MNKKYTKLFVILIVGLIVCVPINVFAIHEDVYVWSKSVETNAELKETSKEETNNLKLESGAAILIDQSTGQVLYEYNCHE